MESKSERIVVDESVLANLFGSRPETVAPAAEVETPSRVETDSEDAVAAPVRPAKSAPPPEDRTVPESPESEPAPVPEEVVEAGGGESVYDRESLLSRALMPTADEPAPVAAKREPADAGHFDTLLRDGSEKVAAGPGEEVAQPAADADEDDPKRQHEQGNRHFSAGDYARAAEAYGKVIEIDPKSWSARFNLGMVLELLDRHEEALAEYQVARKLDANRIDAIERCGFVELRLAQYSEALSDFGLVLAAAPRNSRALFGQGCAQQGLGMYKEADECYQSLAGKLPANKELLANLAVTCLALKDYPRALACAAEMAEGGEATEEFLRLRIDCAGVTGDDETVAQLSARLVELAKDSYDSWFNLGVACQRTGRLEVAVEAYKQALKVDPDRPEAQVNLGAVLHESENPVEARGFYESALRSGLDQHPGVCWNLGLAAESAGALDIAEQAYRETVRSQPEWKEAVGRLTRLNPSHGAGG